MVFKNNWSSPVYCKGCNKECRQPNRYFKGDASSDPRVVYNANGLCNSCYSKKRREDSGVPTQVFIDWTQEVNCTKCNGEMRATRSKPDGRVRYGAYGLCINCYRVPRRRAIGISEKVYVKFDSTHQECSGCKRWLEHQRFAKDHNGNTRSGLRTVCTQCIGLQARHSLTYMQYLDLLDRYNNCCQVCNKPKNECHLGLVIDHDHNCCKSGKSCDKCRRGVLCSNCNAALGSFRDNRFHISRAIEYLGQGPHILPTPEQHSKSYMVSETHKYCGGCDQIVEIDKFNQGKGHICRRCINFKRFGITRRIYDHLLKEQNYSCWICADPYLDVDRKRLHIDHDHSCCPYGGSCGKCVRGLLCTHCNKAIGLVNESVKTLKSLIDYLSPQLDDAKNV